MSRCPDCGSKECCGGTMSERIEELEDTLRRIYTLNGSGDYERDWVSLKQIAGGVLATQED